MDYKIQSITYFFSNPNDLQDIRNMIAIVIQMSSKLTFSSLIDDNLPNVSFRNKEIITVQISVSNQSNSHLEMLLYSTLYEICNNKILQNEGTFPLQMTQSTYEIVWHNLFFSLTFNLSDI